MPSPRRFAIPSITRLAMVLAVSLLMTTSALAKSAGCTSVSTFFPAGGTSLAPGTQTINTFATGEVLTFTDISGTSTIVVTQGDGSTISTFVAPGTYISLPITSAGVARVFVSNTGATIDTLSAVCNEPSSFTVTVTSDPATGNASNCTAGSTTDASCSLRDAVAAVNALSGAGGTIFFSPAVIGTITLTHGNLELTANAVANITGPGANILTLSGNNASNILQVDSGATATISGLTFTAGNASSGGAIQTSSKLTVSACSFNANQATVDGGAISSGTSPLTVTSSSFYNNTTANLGGAISTSGASAVSINNSTFAGNSALNGGALRLAATSASLTNTTIAGNTATNFGGGIYALGGGVIALANTTVAGNTATLAQNPDVLVNGTTVADNGGNYFSTAATSGASTLNPRLLPLASYGGPMQTMLPAPFSPLLCQGLASAATTAGLTLDERNNPRTTAYGATTCVDIGAVQSKYSLSFVQQPTDGIVGITLSPAPTVQLKEGEVAIAVSAQPVVMSVIAGTLGGTLSRNTDATGLSTYSDLTIGSMQTADKLTATLAVSTSPALSVAVNSNAFNVIVPITAFQITNLSATSTAGGAVTFTVTALNGTSVATNYTGTITISSAQDPLLAFVGGSVMYTFTLADAGVHTFTIANGAVFKKAGSDFLTVTDTGFNIANTSATTVTVSPAAPALLTAVSGTGQSVSIGGTFTAPLIVKVTDTYGNPNTGVTVTFAGPVSGTGTAPASTTATTIADGTASLTTIANSTASPTAYSVAASVTGIASPVTFLLTNTQAASRINLSQAAPLPVAAGTGTNVQTTFVATLSDATPNSAGLPTGSVQFYSGATPLGTSVAVVSGQAVLTTSFAAAGMYNITAQYAGDNNFTASTSTIFHEVVAVPGYTIAVNPTSLTITRGDTTTANLNITPVGNYQGTLTYSCTGMPQFSSCLFLPASVTLVGDNAVQNITLTIYTLGPSNSAALRRGRNSVLAAGLLWIPALALASLLMLRRKKSGSLSGLLALLLLTVGMLGMNGCGTQHYYTTLGPDTATVTTIGTATPGSGSADLNQTVTLPITIKQ